MAHAKLPHVSLAFMLSSMTKRLSGDEYASQCELEISSCRLKPALYILVSQTSKDMARMLGKLKIAGCILSSSDASCICYLFDQ